MQNKEEEGKQLLGSKAWQLLRRRALGYAVPAFFVLDRNFFFRFLGERRARYEELLRHPDAETGAAISALLAECECRRAHCETFDCCAAGRAVCGAEQPDFARGRAPQL